MNEKPMDMWLVVEPQATQSYQVITKWVDF